LPPGRTPKNFHSVLLPPIGYAGAGIHKTVDKKSQILIKYPSITVPCPAGAEEVSCRIRI
jgi:hypothetical protein